MCRFHSFLFVVAFIHLLASGSATSAVGQTLKAVQLSNGSSVELRVLMEGAYEWFESSDGFAVVRTPDRYEYAFPLDDGSIVASGVLAVREPQKLPFPPGLRPTLDFLRKKRAEVSSPSSSPSPNPILVEQPDGTKLEIYLKGSANYSWYEDKIGYTIIAIRGRMEYAIRNPAGALIGTGIEVDSMKPTEAGLTPGIRPSDEFLRKRNSSR